MLFEEIQSYRKFLWMLAPVPISWAFLFANWSTEKNPADKQEILLALIFAVVVGLLVLWLFIVMKLVTRIDREGISYQFHPFLKKRQYKWSEVKQAYVRKYRPISEYGGWGLRVGWIGSGRAFNVWGNKGLQLELQKGTRILIGTQKHHRNDSVFAAGERKL